MLYIAHVHVQSVVRLEKARSVPSASEHRDHLLRFKEEVKWFGAHTYAPLLAVNPMQKYVLLHLVMKTPTAYESSMSSYDGLRFKAVTSGGRGARPPISCLDPQLLHSSNIVFRKYAPCNFLPPAERSWRRA